MFGRSDQFVPSDGEQDLAGRLRRHVEHLAGTIGPRHISRPEAFEAAVAYVAESLAARGEPVERFPYSVDGYQVSNLVLERRGVTRPEEIVVVGAHYDTLIGTPGADDNGSAVAMLLELARLLHGQPTERTIRFVSFPCEECPYYETDQMGSRQYARQCRERGEKIIGMFCLEMVGFYTTAPNSQRIPKELPRIFSKVFPSHGDFLAVVSNFASFGLLLNFRKGFKRAVDFPLYAVPLPQLVKSARRSDHSSFWDYGYPALLITDTSLLRNPYYHQATDVPEALDYPRMARVARGVAGAMMHLAGRS